MNPSAVPENCNPSAGSNAFRDLAQGEELSLPQVLSLNVLYLSQTRKITNEKSSQINLVNNQ